MVKSYHVHVPSHKVQQTQQQRLLRGQMLCSQFVMPPHDIVSHLYAYPEIFFPIFTGEPGRLERYWEENTDLYESLGLPNFEPWLFWYLLVVFC